MQILSLVTGPESVPESVRLTAEIRAFNAEIDFRLRFLHMEIDQAVAARTALVGELGAESEHMRILDVAEGPPLQTAATLALLLQRERPSLLVILGDGELQEPAAAAATAVGTRMAMFGERRGAAPDALDLGADAATAVERITGVAREIR